MNITKDYVFSAKLKHDFYFHFYIKDESITVKIEEENVGKMVNAFLHSLDSYKVPYTVEVKKEK